VTVPSQPQLYRPLASLTMVCTVRARRSHSSQPTRSSTRYATITRLHIALFIHSFTLLPVGPYLWQQPCSHPWPSHCCRPCHSGRTDRLLAVVCRLSRPDRKEEEERQKEPSRPLECERCLVEPHCKSIEFAKGVQGRRKEKEARITDTCEQPQKGAHEIR